MSLMDYANKCNDQFLASYDRYNRMSNAQLQDIIRQIRNHNYHFSKPTDSAALKKVCQERGLIP